VSEAHRPSPPLARAEAIPPDHPVRDVFFFGTLADREVLERLLGHPVPAARLRPARLPGFRVVRARGTPYPVLVTDPAAAAQGVLLTDAAAEDIRRIDFYECDEYRAELREVEAGGRRRPAWVFVHREEVLDPDDVPWDPRAWARTHKARLLAEIDAWLEEYRAERAALERREKGEAKG